MTSVSGIDYNLLSVLAALLEERNLTRAGAKLSLSQPAMSGALVRLRRHFGDELLVRSGREYLLTAEASRLLPVVRQAIGQVERTLATPLGFDPATGVRGFTIAIFGQSVLALSGLVRRVHDLAPGVRLDMRPIPERVSERTLLQYDVLIAPEGMWAGGQSEVVLRDRLVYVADPANPRLRDGRLSIEDLAALPHAVGRPADPGGGLATVLKRAGLTPNVKVTAVGSLLLPFLVAGTDLVAVVPERLARQVAVSTGVIVVDPPFGPVEYTESAWWHPMHATDPALIWLRAVLREVAQSRETAQASRP